MNLQHRIDLLVQLGSYILSDQESWKQAKDIAGRKNSWFIPSFIDLATKKIAEQFLNREILNDWVNKYNIPQENLNPKNVGVIMAGNIPLAGFHDFLCVFITGNKITSKLSSKDEILLEHLATKLIEWEPSLQSDIIFADMLKGCDAYIATGSNNTSRYFEFYFGKYPNIIRRNRTSVAILNGKESKEDFDKLADDVYLYFGLGCRNVTKLFIPAGYDFVPLLNAFNKYNYLAENHKYKNNYDYNLALLILNKQLYMSNESILLTEDKSIFSPISRLNYEYYTSKETAEKELSGNNDLQCIVGSGHIAFGQAQYPSINDFADGVNTIEFLLHLPS
ncbi:MAG: acyl-CoA reductase [Bacteroidetes bacterium]|nr:acyl-CoA reductase [Bacteroidota bacterium]